MLFSIPLQSALMETLKSPQSRRVSDENKVLTHILNDFARRKYMFSYLGYYDGEYTDFS